MNNERVKITTEKGKFRWVVIAGEGLDNYRKTAKIYQANVILSKEAAAPFIDACNKLLEEEHTKGYKLQSMPFNYCDSEGNTKIDPADEDCVEYHTEATTEFVLIRSKTNTTFKYGKDSTEVTKQIKIYSGKNTEIRLPKSVKIGNDSVGRISGSIQYYSDKKDSKGKNEGISYYIDAIQLIELIEYVADVGFAQDDSGQEFTRADENGESMVETSSTEDLHTAHTTHDLGIGQGQRKLV